MFKKAITKLFAKKNSTNMVEQTVNGTLIGIDKQKIAERAGQKATVTTVKSGNKFYMGIVYSLFGIKAQTFVLKFLSFEEANSWFDVIFGGPDILQMNIEKIAHTTGSLHPVKYIFNFAELSTEYLINTDNDFYVDFEVDKKHSEKMAKAKADKKKQTKKPVTKSTAKSKNTGKKKPTAKKTTSKSTPKTTTTSKKKLLISLKQQPLKRQLKINN